MVKVVVEAVVEPSGCGRTTWRGVSVVAAVAKQTAVLRVVVEEAVVKAVVTEAVARKAAMNELVVNELVVRELVVRETMTCGSSSSRTRTAERCV